MAGLSAQVVNKPECLEVSEGEVLIGQILLSPSLYVVSGIEW